MTYSTLEMRGKHFFFNFDLVGRETRSCGRQGSPRLETMSLCEMGS